LCRRLRRISKAGRSTPDASAEDTEGTRHGLPASNSTQSFNSGSSDYGTRGKIGTAAAPAFPFSSAQYASSSVSGGSNDAAGFAQSLSRSGTKASTTGSVSTVLDGDLDLLTSTDAEYAAEGDTASATEFGSQPSGIWVAFCTLRTPTQHPSLSKRACASRHHQYELVSREICLLLFTWK
jgi:hypothetical protein